jgi:hypothetical protein
MRQSIVYCGGKATSMPSVHVSKRENSALSGKRRKTLIEAGSHLSSVNSQLVWAGCGGETRTRMMSPAPLARLISTALQSHCRKQALAIRKYATKDPR